MSKVLTSIDRMLLFVDSKIMNTFNSLISSQIPSNTKIKDCFKKIINYSKKSAEIRMELIHRDEVENFIDKLNEDQ